MITVAILGCDDEVLAVAGALGADPRFRVVGIYDADRSQAALGAMLPGVDCFAEWESLLVAGPQVVLVGRQRTSALADDQLRKLVQAGVPLLLTQPPCEAIVALELEMIRRDSKAALAVYYPGCRHSTRTHLASLAKASQEGVVEQGAGESLGRIEQVLVERHLDDRGREAVTRQLACDVHWLQPIVGDIRQVSALAAGHSAEDVSNLSVQMTAESGQLVRWSVHPLTAGGLDLDSIKLIGSTSQVSLQMRPRDTAGSGASVTAGTSTNLARAAVEVADAAEALTILAELAEAGKSAGKGAGKPAHDEQDWAMAVRALEVLDAVLVSLRRGRTIELQKTQLSEQSTFKGMMAAAGCLMLLVAPFILIGAAVIDRLHASFQPRVAGQRATAESQTGANENGSPTRIGDTPQAASSGERVPAAKPRRFPWLAVVLATPLVVFLLLQTLQLVFHGKDSRAGSKEL